MVGRDLSPSQLNALEYTERVFSALSFLGFLFVVSTYLYGQGFRKPVNRLIFYAAWSNLGTTLAGLIAGNGMTAGDHSFLCQFQAFVIQMLQGVDAYWALCMALNVYLALFHGWSTKRMKSRDWKYLWTCYGLSLIPAIVYLFIDTPDRGKIYGPATIWCWINPKWAFLRIATLYGIVWLALLGALIIYSIALTKAWHQRRALVGLLNPLNENPFAGVVTTDIEIVFSKADDEVAHDLAHGPAAHCQWASLDLEDGKRPYTVNVHGQPIGSPRGQRPSRPELLRLPSLTRQAALAEENHEAWLYARVAFLYFIAMIICWLPASINRLVTFIDPTKIIFGLNYAAIIFLPSQGFLNALVYCVSSQTAVKNVFRKLFARGHNRGKPRSAERIRDSDVVVFHETHYPNKDSAVEQPSRPPEFHRPMLHPRDS